MRRFVMTSVFCFLSVFRAGGLHAKDLPGKSIYNLKQVWTDQSGNKQNLDSLRGKVRVVAMIYTHCKSACPMIVEYMKNIAEQLPVADRGDVGFALFSIDSKKDDPKTLTAFAKSHVLDLKYWSLYDSNQANARELAAALGFNFKDQPDGTFIHDNMISVLDQDGLIVKQQKDLDGEVSSILKVILNLSRGKNGESHK